MPLSAYNFSFNCNPSFVGQIVELTQVTKDLEVYVLDYLCRKNQRKASKAVAHQRLPTNYSFIII